MSLTLRRGNDKTWEITVKNKITGATVDITGCTLTMTVRSNINSAIFWQDDFTLTTPLLGVAEIEIPAAITEALANASYEYVYDVEIVKTDTKKETLVVGKFIILPVI